MTQSILLCKMRFDNKDFIPFSIFQLDSSNLFFSIKINVTRYLVYTVRNITGPQIIPCETSRLFLSSPLFLYSNEMFIIHLLSFFNLLIYTISNKISFRYKKPIYLIYICAFMHSFQILMWFLKKIIYRNPSLISISFAFWGLYYPVENYFQLKRSFNLLIRYSCDLSPNR